MRARLRCCSASWTTRCSPTCPTSPSPPSQQLHPQVIRYDVSWAHTAPRKPADATNADDPAYDWSLPDQVVTRADALGVPVMLTIEVTPRWAGGGTGNKAPVNMASLQAFAYAAATRYSGQHIVPSTGQVLPAVTRWEAWNEPNTTSHLTPQYSCRCSSALPVAPGIYAKILTAIYKGIHSAGTHAGIKEIVAGGATKPNYSGPKTFEPAVAPLRFALLLGKKHPPLDVYSHHPYRTDVGKKVGQLPGPERHRVRRPAAPDQGPGHGLPGQAPAPLGHRVRAADEPARRLPGRQPRESVAAAAAQRRLGARESPHRHAGLVPDPRRAGAQAVRRRVPDGPLVHERSGQAGLVGVPLPGAVTARQSGDRERGEHGVAQREERDRAPVEVRQVVEGDAAARAA